MCLIKDIWGLKAQTRAKAAAEPSRAVHEQWQANDNAHTREIPQEKNYASHNGGGVAGPTLLAAQTCRLHANNTFAQIFVSILTLDSLAETVRQSNKYAYEDWVKPVYHPPLLLQKEAYITTNHASQQMRVQHIELIGQPMKRNGKLPLAIYWQGLEKL